MGSKGSSTPTKQEVVQTNLPEYVRPYFERLLNRTEAESQREYEPYGGQRIADVGQDIIDSEGKVRDIAGAGLPGLTDAMGRVKGSLNYTPYDYADARQFTGAEVDKYMSPYMDAVIDRQKQGDNKPLIELQACFKLIERLKWALIRHERLKEERQLR